MKEFLQLFKRENIQEIESKLDTKSLDLFKVIIALLEDPTTEVHRFTEDRYINNASNQITVRLMDDNTEILIASNSYFIDMRIPEKAFNAILSKFDARHQAYRQSYEALISDRRASQINSLKDLCTNSRES